ncbi:MULTISPECIES: carbonic anhydrase [Sulfolobaceae]|uniref:carbonic anhydrase n=1 Tax=Sulfolobaceae TaxID=118883 RepID=UPI000B22AD4E|nr:MULTISPECIES: carbonic anhydrase [unclassified Sulfolobus]
MRLVISCMDRRLNHFLRENYSDSIVVRNAGANMLSLSKTLEKYKNMIDEVIVLPHTDCGAMKVVFSSIKEGKKITSIVEDKLVNQFRDKAFNTLSELERLNLEVQTENAKKIFVNKPIKSEIIDINKIKIPASNQPYSIYVTTPTTPLDLSSSTYVVSAETNDIWDSLDIAIYVMKINNVIVKDDKVAEKIKSIYPSVNVIKPS